MTPTETLTLVFILLSIPSSALTQADETYDITEEDSEGSFVGNVARDLNIAAFFTPEELDQLQYSILNGGDGGLFRIDPAKSDLYTSEKLDREIVCRFESVCRLSLRVAARSQSSIRTYGITVNLLDINDNAPRFNESVFVMSIPESVTAGTRYTIPGALDDDRGGTNSVQSYKLIQGREVFDIEYFQKLDGTSDVTLIVKAALNRETQDFYSAMVVAEDGGVPPRSASLQIDVHIQDVNDNSPSFPQAEYRVQIGENTEKGAVILQLTAQDKDIGTNAEIQYRLSFHQDATVSEQFEIGRKDGSLKARVALTSGSYSIIVEAVDGGTPQKVNQTVVSVIVIDTENNPPSIMLDTLNLEDSQTAYVSEGANIKTPVAHVTIIDPDSGSNGNVKCYSQSAFFDLIDLDSKTYGVFLSKSLDREDISQYLVTLFCEDSGSPKLNATKVFNVVVQDVNDNPPVFDDVDSTVSIAEGNSIGDVVLLISATDIDADENAKIYFSLLDDSDGFFSVPLGSNALTLSKVLDRETKDVHVISILAKDGGEESNSATATVTVSVLDINDVTPQFFQSRYSFSIAEGLPAGSFVGSVSAYDRDLGDGGKVSFSLPSGSSGRGKFQMLANGTLMTLTPLDREANPTFTFPIEVADNGRPSLSSQMDVEVVVEDINDNSPMFLFPSATNKSLTFYLPLDSSKSLVTLQVIDADEGRNGDVTFFLHPGNFSRLFRVDDVTGQMFAVRDLDTEDIGMYNLSVSATDMGDVALSTMHSLYIHVKIDPVHQPVQSSDSNIVIALALVGGTLLLAAIIVLVVCLVRKRDKGSKLRYLDTKPSNDTSGPRVLDASALPQQYDKHQEFNNNNNNNNNNNKNNNNGFGVSLNGSGVTANYRKHSVVSKLSGGYTKEPDRASLQKQTDGSFTFDPMGVKGDEVDTHDKELNRVTSLRLQQAFQHISSIKSRLITPSDTGKPYEWREIHIPGEFGSLSSRSTTYNNNNVDSGIGTDDDAVFVQRPHSSRNTRSPYRHKSNSNHYHQHHHHHHHHQGGQSRRFASQPPSDTSADSSHPSCSSLPNLCLRPGSDTFVFRPLSARSSESFPSETIDDQCTTTSGSYSINMDEMSGASLQLRTSPFIQDVYV